MGNLNSRAELRPRGGNVQAIQAVQKVLSLAKIIAVTMLQQRI